FPYSKLSLIFCAIFLIIIVGTASPILCLIFISFSFKNCLFSSWLIELRSFSELYGAHLKSLGMFINNISPLMLKTLSSQGWTVFWLEILSFLVCTHGATFSHCCRVYLSPFLFTFSTLFPSTTLCGLL